MKLNPFKKNKKPRYKCSCCGKEYDEVPLCFGADYPDYYYSVPPDERHSRVEMAESLCVVDGVHFFHRCRLVVPVNDYHEDLVWNVWTSISEDNFIKRNELWENPARVYEEPYFGWLQTAIPTYGETLNIKTVARERQTGLIPDVEIIEEEHPLQTDQQNGITMKKALEIVDVLMREEHGKE